MNRFLGDLTSPKNSLSTETRFNLAYDTAHGFLQVALRMRGYRTQAVPGHRVILFELLPVLVPGAAGSQESLTHAHNLRNRIEYDSFIDLPKSLVDDLVGHARSVGEEVDHAFRKFKAARQLPLASVPRSPSTPAAARAHSPKNKR